MGRSLTAFRPAAMPMSSRTSVPKNVVKDGPMGGPWRSSVTFAQLTGADATVLLVEAVLPEHDRDFAGK